MTTFYGMLPRVTVKERNVECARQPGHYGVAVVRGWIIHHPAPKWRLTMRFCGTADPALGRFRIVTADGAELRGTLSVTFAPESFALHIKSSTGGRYIGGDLTIQSGTQVTGYLITRH